MRSGFVQVPNVVAIPGDPAWASLVKNGECEYTLRQTNKDDIAIVAYDDELAGVIAAGFLSK